jgi:hypothetical protein
LGCGFIKERAKEGVKKKASEFLRERERERERERSLWRGGAPSLKIAALS